MPVDTGPGWKVPDAVRARLRIALAYWGVANAAVACLMVPAAALRTAVTPSSLLMTVMFSLLLIALVAATRAAHHGRGTRVSPPLPALSSQAQGFGRFPADYFLEQLRFARHRVRILDTYTALLADQDRRGAALDRLRAVVNAGGNVQILLLDAESDTVGQRTRALEDTLNPRVYRHRLQDNLRELYLLTNELQNCVSGRLQVKLIDSLPPITCYQCDDRILTTFVPLALPTDDAPQSLVPARGSTGQFVDRVFDNLWNHGDTLEDRMFCTLNVGAGYPSPKTTRARYVALDGSDTRYLAVVDPELARAASVLDVIEADLPDEEGTRAPRLYRPRAIDEDPLLFEALSIAIYLKYGNVEGDEELFEMTLAEAMT